GFDVVHVDVLALADAFLGDADVLAVFPDRVALLDIGERHLVADRHVHLRFQLERRVVVGDHAQHVGAFFQALDHDDADSVLPVVYQQLRNSHGPPRSLEPSWNAGLIYKTGPPDESSAPAVAEPEMSYAWPAAVLPG